MPYFSIRLNTFLVLICIGIFSVANCENNTEVQNDSIGDFTTELIEGGRTFFQRTLKRFALIAPAIFFKLGIAFTLLLLVTLVAVNNGFIGFLILVVGLSSVLARLQRTSVSAESVQHVPASYAPLHSLPHFAHYHHHPWIDRSDSADVTNSQKYNNRNVGYHENRPTYDSNSDLRNTGVYYKNYPTDV